MPPLSAAAWSKITVAVYVADSPVTKDPSCEPWSLLMYIMYGGVAGDTKANVLPPLSVTTSFTIMFVKSAEPVFVTVIV